MLLDTCIAIDYLRRNSVAVSWFSSLKTKPALSVITVMELYAGAKSQKEEARIKQLYESMDLFKTDLEISRRAGEFLKHYKDSHNIGGPDALIAATADIHSVELVTLNLKHFPMFAKLKRPY